LRRVVDSVNFPAAVAADADGRKFGALRYELATAATAAGKFTLSTTRRKVDGSTDVRLVLAGRLDREAESQYRLRLMAYDGGEPARSASVDIIVSVADSNDNRPRFTSDEYQATVTENAPVGTVVVQVDLVQCTGRWTEGPKRTPAASLRISVRKKDGTDVRTDKRPLLYAYHVINSCQSKYDL